MNRAVDFSAGLVGEAASGRRPQERRVTARGEGFLPARQKSRFVKTPQGHGLALILAPQQKAYPAGKGVFRGGSADQKLVNFKSGQLRRRERHLPKKAFLLLPAQADAHKRAAEKPVRIPDAGYGPGMGRYGTQTRFPLRCQKRITHSSSTVLERIVTYMRMKVKFNSDFFHEKRTMRPWERLYGFRSHTRRRRHGLRQHPFSLLQKQVREGRQGHERRSDCVARRFAVQHGFLPFA